MIKSLLLFSLISFTLFTILDALNEIDALNEVDDVYCQGLGECSVSQKFYVEKPFKSYVIDAASLEHYFWKRDYPLLYDSVYDFNEFPMNSTIIINNNIYVRVSRNEHKILDFCLNKSCQLGLNVYEFVEECIPKFVEVYATYYTDTSPLYHHIFLNATIRMGVTKCGYPIMPMITICALNNVSSTCRESRYEWTQFFEKIKTPPGMDFDGVVLKRLPGAAGYMENAEFRRRLLNRVA